MKLIVSCICLSIPGLQFCAFHIPSSICSSQERPLTARGYDSSNGYGSSNSNVNGYSNGTSGGYGGSSNGYGGGSYGGGDFGGSGDKMSNLGANLKTQHWGGSPNQTPGWIHANHY